MPDDEPLDDARQVATAAGTAAARLIETAARQARDAAARHRATLERSQDQQRARDALSDLDHRFTAPEQDRQREVQLAGGTTGHQLDELQGSDRQTAERLMAEAGLQAGQPRESRYERLDPEVHVPDENDAWDRHNERRSAAEDALYDRPEQRAKRDSARAAAGVPADAREVRATSDTMNGTDPATAAARLQGRGSTNSPSMYGQQRQARLSEQAPPTVKPAKQTTPTR